MNTGKFSSVPSSAKYRNQSQIEFLDQGPSKNQINKLEIERKERRSKNYRTFSRLGQFMKDTAIPTKPIEKVHYINIIQNVNKTYEIPKPLTKFNEKQEHRYQEFLQKNQGQISKPKDQFCQYSDLITKNALLIRKDQSCQSHFTTKTRLNTEQNSKTISMIHSKYYKQLKATKYNNITLSNSIWQSFQNSVSQKKQIQNERISFRNQKKKQIKPFNKTFIGNLSEYHSLINKNRQEPDKVPLKNSMSRVLLMEIMGKQIQNLTQTFT